MIGRRREIITTTGLVVVRKTRTRSHHAAAGVNHASAAVAPLLLGKGRERERETEGEGGGRREREATRIRIAADRGIDLVAAAGRCRRAGAGAEIEGIMRGIERGGAAGPEIVAVKGKAVAVVAAGGPAQGILDHAHLERGGETGEEIGEEIGMGGMEEEEVGAGGAEAAHRIAEEEEEEDTGLGVESNRTWLPLSRVLGRVRTPMPPSGS